jgi:hypothetical protein
MGAAKTRQWITLQGDDGTLLLVGEDSSRSVMVRVKAEPWEITDGAPERLCDDAKLTAQIFVELLAYELTDEELGAFVRLQYEPVVDALRGRWTWTKRVTNAAPRETTPWNDSSGLR